MNKITVLNSKRVLAPYFCHYKKDRSLSERVFAAGAFLSMLLPQAICLVGGGLEVLGFTGGLAITGTLIGWTMYLNRNSYRGPLLLELETRPGNRDDVKSNRPRAA